MQHAQPGRRAGAAGQRFRGFTLIEMIIVLLVLAVMMAVVAPSLRGFADGRRASDAARSLTALAAWARSQAVSEGRLYRLHVDGEAGTYWVTAEQGGAFERVEAPLGRTFEISDRVTVAWEEPDDVQRLGYVTFHPTGRVTPATLAVREASGMVTRVRAESVTDRFVVVGTQQEGGGR